MGVFFIHSVSDTIFAMIFFFSETACRPQFEKHWSGVYVSQWLVVVQTLQVGMLTCQWDTGPFIIWISDVIIGFALIFTYHPHHSTMNVAALICVEYILLNTSGMYILCKSEWCWHCRWNYQHASAPVHNHILWLLMSAKYPASGRKHWRFQNNFFKCMNCSFHGDIV
jgi:hypothetical protein